MRAKRTSWAGTLLNHISVFLHSLTGVFGLRYGAFLATGVYLETYAHDDVYLRIVDDIIILYT